MSIFVVQVSVDTRKQAESLLGLTSDGGKKINKRGFRRVGSFRETLR